MKKRKLNIKNLLLFLSFVFVILIIIVLLFKIVKKDSTKKEVKKESKKTEAKVIGKEPVITLNGESEIKVVLNGVYDDLGASATDEEDGDLTKSIKVTDNVNYKKAGDYEIIYSVTDSDNNESKISRKVTVFEVKDKNTSGVPVLMYHYFYDDENGETGGDANYMAKSLFEGQLKYLSENDYYFPTMKELSLYVDGKLDLPEKSVILTLDDGEESNYRIAYPLAKKYKVPLVMFVVTSWTDVSMEYQTEMKNTGYIRFHSHTDDMHQGGCSEKHGALILCIDHDKGVQDLKTSAEKLGNSDALAYPCGDTNESGMSIVKDAGISLAFTTEYGKVHVGDNRYDLKRVRMNDGISLDSFISSL